MPPIPAAHLAIVLKAVVAFIAFGLTAMTAVQFVGFPNHYYDGATETPLPPLKHSLAVEYGPESGFESCPTCLFADAQGLLLDYYGRPIDLEKLLEDKPTPTLPLTISYATPTTLRPKPTPTPAKTPEVKEPPVPTSDAPPVRPVSNPNDSPPVVSFLDTILRWIKSVSSWYLFPFQNLVFFLTNTATPSITTIGLSDLAWLFACRLASVVFSRIVVASLPYLQRVWKIQRAKFTSSKFQAQRATRTTAILKHYLDPATLKSAIYRLWVENVNGEQARHATFQAATEQMVFGKAITNIKETLRRLKTKMIWKASEEFRKLRIDHEDKLKAANKREGMATANIEPSFGPSLRNAEAELRRRINPVPINEGTRENIIGMFKSVLYSFTHAMAVEESQPGGHNTRYLSVIDGQNKLIDSLRLLHEYREKAFAENEDLIMSLCRYDVNGKLIVPDYQQEMPPWDKYSAEFDRFIVSPLDGPTALSMKVSVSSASFQSRPDAVLDSDPHWQRFLDSVAAKRREQEMRHASYENDLREEVAEGTNGIENASMQESQEGLQGRDEESHDEYEMEWKRETGIKDASEQNHKDISPAVPYPRPTSLHQPPSESLTHKPNAQLALSASTGPEQKRAVTSNDRESLPVPKAADFSYLSDDDLKNNPAWAIYMASTLEDS